jgi:hypothetical protein
MTRPPKVATARNQETFANAEVPQEAASVGGVVISIRPASTSTLSLSIGLKLPSSNCSQSLAAGLFRPLVARFDLATPICLCHLVVTSSVDIIKVEGAMVRALIAFAGLGFLISVGIRSPKRASRIALRNIPTPRIEIP